MTQLLEALNAHTKEILHDVPFKRSMIGPPLKSHHELHLTVRVLCKHDGEILVLSEDHARRCHRATYCSHVIKQFRIVQHPDALYIEVVEINTCENPIGELVRAYHYDYCDPSLLDHFDRIMKEEVYFDKATFIGSEPTQLDDWSQKLAEHGISLSW